MAPCQYNFNSGTLANGKIFPNTNLNPLGKTSGQLHFFAVSNLYLLPEGLPVALMLAQDSQVSAHWPLASHVLEHARGHRSSKMHAENGKFSCPFLVGENSQFSRVNPFFLLWRGMRRVHVTWQEHFNPSQFGMAWSRWSMAWPLCLHGSVGTLGAPISLTI